MKKILHILPLFCLLAAPAIAGPPYPLEGLLVRAKVVCVANVETFDGTNVVLAVETNMRGDTGTNTLRFKIDAECGLPQKGQRYFVFSQGHDHWGEPKNEIKVGQGSDCQVSYCGWIMLPVKETSDKLVVQKAYSLELRKPDGSITLDQAKDLVQKTRSKTKADSEQTNAPASSSAADSKR